MKKYTIMSRTCRDDGSDNWSCWDEDPYMQPQEGNPADILCDYMSFLDDNFCGMGTEYALISASDTDATYRYKAHDDAEDYTLLEIRVFEVEED